MFSKALYKQSWKANGILMLCVTLVSCIVLFVIMTMSGGVGIGSLASSFTKTIVKETLEAKFEDSTLNYYTISSESLEIFEESFIDEVGNFFKDNPLIYPDESDISTIYYKAVEKYSYNASQMILNINPNYVEGTDEYTELATAVLFVINPGGMLDGLYLSFEETEPTEYDIESIINNINDEHITQIWSTGIIPNDFGSYIKSDERILYRYLRSKEYNSIYLAGIMNTPDAIDIILEEISVYGFNQTDYDSFLFTYDNLKHLSQTAIISYKNLLDYEISNLDKNDIEYELKLLEIKVRLRKNITDTLMTKLPDELAGVLSEIGEQDMYTTTVGNMYYKIVGILLSMIYIIMVSVNLISGQVDSGSMAYVLSTGTKRNTVSFTQIIFLLSSTFIMYLLTTSASVIAYKISPPTLSSVTLSKLLLFNLGGFLVSIAFCGINFLTSGIFNRSRQAMAIGGGITILNLIFTILGMFGGDVMPSLMRVETLNIFNKISFITLLDITSILEGNLDYIWKFGILLFIGLVCFIAGSIIFKKKDLPL